MIECLQLNADKSVTILSIAVNHATKNSNGEWENGTQWFSITLFKPSKLLKGDHVELTG